MNNWNLTDEIRNKFKPIVEDYISLLESDKLNNEHRESIDFTNQGISPVQLKELLEELGYEEVDYDSNGWQHDFWQYMNNPNREKYAKDLCIYGCGMTFDLALGSDVDD